MLFIYCDLFIYVLNVKKYILISQISYATMDSVLSDKVQFPFFYRTVPNDYDQFKAFIHLIQHFEWTWIGVLVSDNESGLKFSQFLQKELTHIGYCSAFIEFIPYHDALSESKRNRIAQLLITTSVNVIILFVDQEYIRTLRIILYMFPIKQKVWIIASQWDISAGFDYYFLNFQPFNGSIAVSVATNKIPGFESFVLSLSPKLYPNDIFLKLLWEELFICDYTSVNCTENSIQDSILPKMYRDFSFHSYSIYNAVYTLAHALHQVYLDIRDKNFLMENKLLSPVS